jgi:hypothetical protein
MLSGLAISSGTPWPPLDGSAWAMWSAVPLVFSTPPQGTAWLRVELTLWRAEALMPDNAGRRIAVSRPIGALAVSFSRSGEWASGTTVRDFG